MKVVAKDIEALKTYFYLKPNEALVLVVNTLGYEIGVWGFDDPLICWYPYRWYWHEMEPGKYCVAVCSWRGVPTVYENLIKP